MTESDLVVERVVDWPVAAALLQRIIDQLPTCGRDIGYHPSGGTLA